MTKESNGAHETPVLPLSYRICNNPGYKVVYLLSEKNHRAVNSGHPVCWQMWAVCSKFDYKNQPMINLHCVPAWHQKVQKTLPAQACCRGPLWTISWKPAVTFSSPACLIVVGEHGDPQIFLLLPDHFPPQIALLLHLSPLENACFPAFEATWDFSWPTCTQRTGASEA